MTRKKTRERKLIKTTQKVAKVLSSTFGIRSGYEAVDSAIRPTTIPTRTRPTIIGTSAGAIALRSFFESQDCDAAGRQLRADPVPYSLLGTIGEGDVVAATRKPFKSFVFVLSCNNGTVRGFRLVPGGETMLHDVLDDNEVLLTRHPVTIRLSSVTFKIEPNSISLRYAWDNNRPAFIGLSEWASQKALDSEEVQFHEGDFVMLSPEDDGPLLDIAQVQRIRKEDVYVRRLYRQALQNAGSVFKDDRLLVPAGELTRIPRPSFQPVSSCQVSLPTEAASSWTSEATEFHVAQDAAVLLHPECAPCTISRASKKRRREDATPLRVMELMCGAGGLSLGLDLSGACETKFAIDTDADSVETFRGHHPNATVYCADAGEALRLAASGRLSDDGRHFPRRGEVDVIAAGPPCQGFSRMNRTASLEEAEKDPRNLLVCTVLGWVDHLRPKYLVLENVEGFTAAKLGGHDQGMVKLVMKVLLALGYAVTCGYVQSGAFGCPQSRGRFILLACVEELTLPSLPPSTHGFLGRVATRYTWSDGNDQCHSTEARPQAAILPAITVTDAIDDLPDFDWKDPHQMYAGPDGLELERARRGVSQLMVIPGQPTGPAKQTYPARPQNSYQERMRVLAGKSLRTVTFQQTSGFTAHVVERVVNVALQPGANYESWSHPSIDKPLLLGPSPVDRCREFKFERLDGERYFKIMMTELKAHGSMLHPTQRRLLTVRECARAQGFPDWVEFHTDANLRSAYRQIGNAVPIPLSNAIGKSIDVARLQDLAREERREPPRDDGIQVIDLRFSV